jgi:hypothetical protein
MAASFDPDSFLASTSEASGGFNPDSFLSEVSSEPEKKKLRYFMNEKGEVEADYEAKGRQEVDPIALKNKQFEAFSSSGAMAFVPGLAAMGAFGAASKAFKAADALSKTQKVVRTGGALAASTGAAIGTSVAQKEALRAVMPQAVESMESAQAAFPKTALLGDLIGGNAPFQKVGKVGPIARELLERSMGAGIAGGIEGGRQITTGEYDPAALGMSVGAGALFNNPTDLGEAAMQTGARVAGKLSSKKPITSQLGNASTKTTVGEANKAANDIALQIDQNVMTPPSGVDPEISAAILSDVMPRKSASSSAKTFIESDLLGPKEIPGVTPDKTLLSELMAAGEEVPTGRDLAQRGAPNQAENTLLADLVKNDSDIVDLQGFQPTEPKAPMDFGDLTPTDSPVRGDFQAKAQTAFNKRVVDAQKNLKAEGVEVDRATAVQLARLADKPEEFNAARQKLIDSKKASEIKIPKKGPIKSLEELPPKIGQDDVADPEFVTKPEVAEQPFNPETFGAKEVVTEPSVKPTTPEPAAPKETPVAKDDFTRYNEIQERWKTLLKEDPASPEINKLWAENEEIKNRHDGMPPLDPAKAKEVPAKAPEVKEAVTTKPVEEVAPTAKEPPQESKVVDTVLEDATLSDAQKVAIIKETRKKPAKQEVKEPKRAAVDDEDAIEAAAAAQAKKDPEPEAAPKAEVEQKPTKPTKIEEEMLSYDAQIEALGGLSSERAKNFALTGSYDVKLGKKKIGSVFRDPENGWWYRTPEKKAKEGSASNPKDDHHSQRVVGFTKKEALNGIAQWAIDNSKVKPRTAEDPRMKTGAGRYEMIKESVARGEQIRPMVKEYPRSEGEGIDDYKKRLHKIKDKGLVNVTPVENPKLKDGPKLGIVPPEDPLVSATRKGVDKLNDVMLEGMARTDVENTNPKAGSFLDSITPSGKKTPEPEVNEPEVELTWADKIYGEAAKRVDKKKLPKQIEDETHSEIEAMARENGSPEPDRSIAKDIASTDEPYRPLLTDLAGRFPIIQKLPGIHTGAQLISSLARLIKSQLGTTQGNIRDVSPRVAGGLREKGYELGKLRTYAKQIDQFNSLVRKSFKKSEFEELNAALLSGDRKKVEGLISAKDNADELMDALEVNLEVKKNLLEDMRKYGRDVGETDFYFRRKLVDREGLAKELERSGDINPYEDGVRAAVKEKKRDLTDDEKDEIMNNIITGSMNGGGKPGFLKSRTIENITEKLSQYYEPFDVADYDYMLSASREINNRKWFGKSEDKLDPFGGNLGKILREEYESGRVEGKGLEIIKENITAFFKTANRLDTDLQKWASRGRRLQTYAYLADFGNMIIQYAEFFTNARRFGTANALTGFGKKKFTLDDIAVFEGGNQDMVQFSRGKPTTMTKKIIKGTEKLYQKSMQTFLGSADKYMTGGTAKSAYSWINKLVKNQDGDEFKKLNAEYTKMFPDKWPAILKDLQSDDFKKGKLNDNTSFFIWNEVANLKPIDPSDRAQGFHNANDFGKLLFTLRTYPLKQLDIMRKIGYEEMKRGNFQRGAAAAGLFALLVGAGQQSINYVRDQIFNRDSPLEEYAVTGFLQTLFMIPRYAFYRAKQASPTDAALDTLIPGLGLTRDFTKDLGMAGRYFLDHKDSRGASTVRDLEDAFAQSRMVQYAPGVGRATYWWLGAGAESEARQKRDEQMGKVKKSTPELISELFIQPDSKAPRKN